MKYAKYKYGTAVAFDDGMAIHFGVIEEVVCRETATRETVEYVILHQDGKITISDDGVISYDGQVCTGVNPGAIAEIYDGSAFSDFDKMVRDCPAKKWAVNRSRLMLEPKPESEAPFVTDGTGAPEFPPPPVVNAAVPITAGETF